MKISGAKVQAFLRAPDPNCPAILIFGTDEGLVQERSVQLAKLVVPDLSDPFRVVEFFASDLKSDPARLPDEAHSLSFGGGRRVVRIRQATDQCVESCEALLNSDVISDTMVILDAGALNPRSKLRKLFEKSKKAVCIPCYPDSLRDLPNVIRECLAHHNLKTTPDAMALLCQSLGSDRSITRGELEKLALYMGDETLISVEHVRNMVGDNTATSLEDVVDAVASGLTDQLEQRLGRAVADGVNPIALIRVCQRHFQRLHLAKGHMASGKNLHEAIKSLRPPVMFMREAAFKRQAGLWTEKKLARAFEILMEAEQHCKTTGFPNEALCSHALLTLTKAAQKR